MVSNIQHKHGIDVISKSANFIEDLKHEANWVDDKSEFELQIITRNMTLVQNRLGL
jgi:hypothetical protein